MAARCDNCNRGREIGHNVSHAKNRTFRLFKPNLQKLMVLKNGLSVHVRFCSSCIQRLRKYGYIGVYHKIEYVTGVPNQKKITVTKPSHKHIDRDSKKIDEIMKKEETKRKDEETAVKTQAKEKIRIEELVGKK